MKLIKKYTIKLNGNIYGGAWARTFDQYDTAERYIRDYLVPVHRNHKITDYNIVPTLVPDTELRLIAYKKVK